MFKPVALSTAALALCLAVPVSAVAQNNPTPENKATSQTKESSPSSLTSQEKSFLDEAAKANNSEIRAGLLAEDEASNPEVKVFGRLMVFDHTELANELSAVAHRFGVSMPAGVTQQAEETTNKLESEQGASFDRAYMEAQVKAHEKAIGLFDKEAKTATNIEVAQLANLSLVILHQHLDLARLIDNALGNQAQASRGNKPQASQP